ASAARVPAMINFTAGLTNIRIACKAAQVSTIVTSRAFIDKAKLGALAAELEKEVRLVYLEDVRGTVSFVDKMQGLLAAKKPLVVARKPDDPAVILFTSGSEGNP